MQTLIAPVTGATTAKNAFETRGRQAVTVAADNLATTEEVDIFMDIGGTWKAVPDGAGGLVTLTATDYSVVLEGGPRYACDKDATAGACGVYFELQELIT